MGNTQTNTTPSKLEAGANNITLKEIIIHDVNIQCVYGKNLVCRPSTGIYQAPTRTEAVGSSGFITNVSGGPMHPFP